MSLGVRYRTQRHFLVINHEYFNEIKSNALGTHPCDKFEKGIRQTFLSFQVHQKLYRIYREILNSDEGEFQIGSVSGSGTGSRDSKSRGPVPDPEPTL